MRLPWLAVAAAAPNYESLSVQNDYWFNHLRGIAPAHEHVSYVGALSQQNGGFDSLPFSDFYLLMVYSPWWYHCRRAVVEFNRLAAALHRTRPLLLDCTRPVNEKVCSRFLGEARKPVPLWTAGVDARPVYVELSDPWPAAAMPVLVVGSQEEFLSEDDVVAEGLAIARLTAGEMSAETMLQWLQRARPEALRDAMELPAAQPPWSLGPGPTDHPSGEASQPRWSRFPEADVRAGLALWLHDIFERQVFELPSDHRNDRSRRKALVDLLALFCAYFPDHLDHLDHLDQPSEDCRESLCHLAWLLEDQTFWDSHVEEVELAVEEADLEGRPGAEPQEPAQIFRTRRRFYRIRWEKLEHHWQLCGEPWPQLAARGFTMCKSADPLAGGLPCGIWGLMHSVLAEIAELHKCTMAHTENPDNCIGPPENTTAEELRKFMKEEAEDMEELQLEKQREFHDEETADKPVRLLARDALGRDGWCLKAQGLYQGYASAPGNNVTAVMRLDALKGRNKVAGKLLSFNGQDVNEMVELQLADDFVRKDGGAVVDRVIKGPSNISAMEFRFYKLRTVEGSPVPSKAAPWQAMLQGALMESPKLVFEGPRPCMGQSEAICQQKCSFFKFEKDTQENHRGNVSLGKLVDVSDTGQKWCVGRLYQRFWFFWSWDVGMGLVPCEEGTLYKNVIYGPGNESFCPEGQHRCLDVDFNLHFEDFPFIAVEPTRDIRARHLSPFRALQIFRRAIQLFWRCDECRMRFLAYRLDKQQVHTPCEASIWLWTVHNDINAKLHGGYAQDSPWPGPNRSPSQWPSRSVCPACFGSNSSKIQLPKLCSFLWNDFYRSWEGRSKRSKLQAKGFIQKDGELTKDLAGLGRLRQLEVLAILVSSTVVLAHLIQSLWQRLPPVRSARLLWHLSRSRGTWQLLSTDEG